MKVRVLGCPICGGSHKGLRHVHIGYAFTREPVDDAFAAMNEGLRLSMQQTKEITAANVFAQDLSETSLVNALRAIARFKDERGLRLTINPTAVLRFGRRPTDAQLAKLLSTA